MLQNVSNEFPGPLLYTITPEEPSHWTFFSICIHTFLSMAGLGFLLLHKDFLLKLWIYLDCTFLSVMFPSFISKDKLLEWAQSRLPDNWSSHTQTLSKGLSELWQDGSLLCTLINSAIPGACANPHRHWNKPPIHAQDLAFKYLGVIPVFTEFEYQSPLNLKIERKFFHYLNLLRNRINSASRTESITHEISKWYVARGMGLYAGEQYKDAIFYIYPQITVSYYHNVLVYIRGPYATNGQIEFSHVPSGQTFDFAQSKELLSKIGTTENCINKFKNCSAFQNKITGKEIIKMTVKIEDDRAKVTYLPAKSGIYEIFVTCNGEPIVGSPFYANIFGTVPRKSFSNDTCYVKRSDRKFSAEYYIRQTKMVSVQNNFNKTDDQKIKTDKKEDNSENTIKNKELFKDENDITACRKSSDDTSNEEITKNPIEKRNILMELNNFNKTDQNKSDLKKLCHITMRSLSNDFVRKVPDNQVNIPKKDTPPKTSLNKITTFNSNAPVVTLAPLHPKTLQKIVRNHRCASPICTDHIVSEDSRCEKITNSNKYLANNSIESGEERPVVTIKKSQDIVKPMKPASPICNNHIAYNRGLSKSVNDVRQHIGLRRDSMASLGSFATDTQSFTCSESDFEALESLRELNDTPLSGFTRKNSNLNSLVLEKKLFWETLANHPEIIKTTNSDNLMTSQALSKSMTRLEEFKNYIKRYRNSPWVRNSKNRFKLSKSVDDLRCSGSANNMSKFRTVDRSLEDCSKLRVDERKQIYLKELENLEKKNTYLGHMTFSESILEQADKLDIKAPKHNSCHQKGSKKSVHFQQSSEQSKTNNSKVTDERILKRKYSSLHTDPRVKDTSTFTNMNILNASPRNSFKNSFIDAIATFSRTKVAPKIWDGAEVKAKVKKRPSLSEVFNVIY